MTRLERFLVFVIFIYIYEDNETLSPVPHLPSVESVLGENHPISDNKNFKVTGTTTVDENTSAETNSNKDDGRKLKIATFVGVLSITAFAISFTQ